MEQSLSWGIGWASEMEIDTLNILQASLLAMKRAFDAMVVKLPTGLVLTKAVVDGLHCPDLPIPCRAMVKADSQVPEVMAASILAKTARDKLMEQYALVYPEYGYEKHKGYPTKEHQEKIARYGPSPIQRKSFKVNLARVVRSLPLENELFSALK
jgi:ribonuclease HII